MPLNLYVLFTQNCYDSQKGTPMKKIILLLSLTFTLLFAEEKSLKIVYDLTTKDMAKFERKILSAIAANKSHYEKSFRDLDVAVVIHGAAYRFFLIDPSKSVYKDDKALLAKHKDLAKRIKSMVENYDVTFLMCAVGMRENKLTPKDVFKFIKSTPNGSIGLIDKQNEGYAYLPVGDK